MDYTKYIVEIKNVCTPSPAKEVLDRMRKANNRNVIRAYPK